MFKKKPSTADSGNAPTYLGGGMRIEGKVTGQRPIWMDGQLEGTIHCESEVVIGPTAKIEATIHASIIKVNGEVKGDLFALDRMEVLSEGRIRGNITNLPGSLIIHEGGVVEGQCLTTSQKELEKLIPKGKARDEIGKAPVQSSTATSNTPEKAESDIVTKTTESKKLPESA